MLFNRNPLIFGGEIEQPSDQEVKNTPGLWNCSLEDAVKYGGDLTRAALSAMNLLGDRAYTIVDTKIHMLMPGFCPAIPGWHTDGVPRGTHFHPAGPMPPDMYAQELPDARPPRFHLLVTGHGCLTEFIKPRNIEVSIPPKPTTELYEHISRLINKRRPTETEDFVFQAPSCKVVEFDWWDLHQGIVATKKEWRFLIRVCETDYQQPQRDLRDIMRTQQQVYIPSEFGW